MVPADAAPAVLIADDDPLLCRSIAALLKNAGYRVLIAHSGRESLELAAAQPLSAAVIDIHLPDLHGLVLTQRLREHVGPACPILILSGDSSMSIINALPHAGATYYFRKPVDARRLLERLAELSATCTP